MYYQNNTTNSHHHLVPPEPAPRKNRPQTSQTILMQAAPTEINNSIFATPPPRMTRFQQQQQQNDNQISSTTSIAVAAPPSPTPPPSRQQTEKFYSTNTNNNSPNSKYSYASTRRQFQQNPYFKPHQLAFTPSPPPPHQSTFSKNIHLRDDPRPFVLGLPKQTAFSARRSMHMENIAELGRRSEQATLIGEEMDQRNDLVCEWAASADALVVGCFVADDEDNKMISSSSYLIIAEELYFRQISALRAEVENEQLQEHKKLIFEHRRDIFVNSRLVRSRIRNFIATWVAVRRAKILKAAMSRENMCRREERIREDLMKDESLQVTQLMILITVELCAVSKRRMTAFLLSTQRGLWMATTCKNEQVERRDLLWGGNGILPPRHLVERILLLGNEEKNNNEEVKSVVKPNLLLSLQCAELAHRDIILSEEISSCIHLQHNAERSHIEYQCLFEKRSMFKEFHDDFMESEFLPRTASILQWHARRDVENSEFETRLEYQETLLKECDSEISIAIFNMRARAQTKISSTWRMFLAKRPMRALQLAVFKEVLRQEREYETELQRQEMEIKFLEHARMESLESVIEPQYRFGLEEPSWQESFVCNLLLVEAKEIREAWMRETWSEFVSVGPTLIEMMRKFHNETELMLIEAEQALLDLAAEESEVWRDLSERFALHCRIKGRLDSIEDDVVDHRHHRREVAIAKDEKNDNTVVIEEQKVDQAESKNEKPEEKVVDEDDEEEL